MLTVSCAVSVVEYNYVYLLQYKSKAIYLSILIVFNFLLHNICLPALVTSYITIKKNLNRPTTQIEQ